MTESTRPPFLISSDPDLLDLDEICEALSRTYWGENRPKEKNDIVLENSLCFGLYKITEQGRHLQIGLARVVTDYAIFAYLCDVYVHEDFRGRGLGKWLISVVIADPRLKEMHRWMLATRDAHGLYRQFGFQELGAPEFWLVKHDPGR